MGLIYNSTLSILRECVGDMNTPLGRQLSTGFILTMKVPHYPFKRYKKKKRDGACYN